LVSFGIDGTFASFAQQSAAKSFQSACQRPGQSGLLPVPKTPS
jgi:hypothetical protein